MLTKAYSRTINGSKETGQKSRFLHSSLLKKGQRNPRILRLVIMSAILCMMILSSSSETASFRDEFVDVPPNNMVPAWERIYQWAVPDTYDVAVGTVGTLRGFAYIDATTHLFYFVDMYHDTYQTLTIPSTGTIRSGTLTGFDFDNDGSTEFFVGWSISGVQHLFMADFNDKEFRDYTTENIVIDQILFGNFDGVTGFEVALTDKQLYDQIITYELDATTATKMAEYNATSGWTLGFASVGYHYKDGYDTILMVSTYGSQSNVSLVSGEKTLPPLDTMIWTNPIKGLATYQYDDGDDREEFAFTDNDGYLTAYEYNDPNLEQLYSRQIDNNTPMYQFYIKTGFFNNDTQEDLVLDSAKSDAIFLIDGSDGTIFRMNNADLDISGNPAGIAVGTIDADDITDVVAFNIGPRNPLFIHGFNGQIAYVETEIENAARLLTYDMNKDDRDDIVISSGKYIYQVMSDKIAPLLTPEPVSPLHPTVLDDYIVIETHVSEDTALKNAELFFRKLDEPWPETGMQMAETTSTNKYFTFLTGLQDGIYEYYMYYRDVYLNEETHGTADDPLNFTVTGNFYWSHHKPNILYGTNLKLFVKGNDSAGEVILYTLTNMEATSDFLNLTWFAADGTELGMISHNLTVVNDYTLRIGDFDGDNVLDPVLIFSNETNKVYKTHALIYHGSDMTLFRHLSYSPYLKRLQWIEVFDSDDDNQDEIHMIDKTTDNLIRLESDNTSIVKARTTDGAIYGMTYARSASDNSYDICIISEVNRMDLYDASDMTHVKTTTFPDGGDEMRFSSLAPFHNSSHPNEQFMVQYNMWDVSNTWIRFYWFDQQTTTFTPRDFFDKQTMGVFLQDTTGEGQEELFLHLTTGELEMAAVKPQADLSFQWSVTLGSSIPTGYTVANFDGNDIDDLVIFTKQDKMMWVVNFDGRLTRTLKVGTYVFNPISIGNVDLGGGDEIAAFPSMLGPDSWIGAVRDLDWYYRMNVHPSFSSMDIIQGNPLEMKVNVTNIYEESVEDASVTISAFYNIGMGMGSQTYGMTYNESSGSYEADADASWPIGIVDFEVSITHDTYHDMFSYPVGSITVRSELIVSAHAIPKTAIQHGNLTLDIVVTDSMDVLIADANVSVTIDTISYEVPWGGSSYHISFEPASFPLGEHYAEVNASHVYATYDVLTTEVFEIKTQILFVDRSMPSSLDQEDLLTGWVNLTDFLGNPLTSATVTVRSGEHEFTLTEEVQGAYKLNEIASLPIGIYTFDVIVDHPYVDGYIFDQFDVAIYGPHAPVVNHPKDVDAGTNFTVSVFVYDNYGTVPENPMAIIEFLDTNYTAKYHSSGSANFTFILNASTSIDLKMFQVFVNSTYGYDWVGKFMFSVHSNATKSLSSSLGWSLNQGDITTLKVNVWDWNGTIVVGAKVTALSPTILLFEDLFNGSYTIEFSLQLYSFAPGNYSLLISIEHPFLEYSQGSRIFEITGSAQVELSAPEPIYNDEELVLNFTVRDQYGNPLNDFNYTLTLDTLSESDVSDSYKFNWTLNPALEPKSYTLSVRINGTYINDETTNFDLTIRGNAIITIISPEENSTHTQDSSINFTVRVRDSIGNDISGAIVKIGLYGSSNELEPSGTGKYWSDIITNGIPIQPHNATIDVSHNLLDTNGTIYWNITLVGSAFVDVVYLPIIIYNDKSVEFNFTITDMFGNPINQFDYEIQFAGNTTTGTSNEYKLSWSPKLDAEPGSHKLNITITHAWIISTTRDFWYEIWGTSNTTVLTPTQNQIFTQEQDVNFTIWLHDLLDYNISDASVIVNLRGSLYTLDPKGEGIYSRNISTSGFPLGEYNATVSISHELLNTTQTTISFSVKGYAKISFVKTPDTVYNHQDLMFNFTIVDKFGNPVKNFNYSISFTNDSTSGKSEPYEFTWETTPNVLPGSYWLNVTINGTYVMRSTYNTTINIHSTTSTNIVKPSDGGTYSQGSDINFTVSVVDLIGLEIDDATVSVLLRGSTYKLDSKGNGIYGKNISTIGFSIGQYNATISVSQSYLNTSDKVVKFTLEGLAYVTVEYLPSIIYNHLDLDFDFTVTDQFGNPINSFNYTVSFANDTYSNSSDSYRFSWNTTPNVLPGQKWLNISINGTGLIPSTYNTTFNLWGTSSTTIEKPVAEAEFTQGDNINFTVLVQDLIGNNISDATVTVLLRGSSYPLSLISQGYYSSEIFTFGIPVGEYNATISIIHSLLNSTSSLVSFSIKGSATVTVTQSPSTAFNHLPLNFSFTVVDKYGNPINSFDYSITFANSSTTDSAISHKFWWAPTPNIEPGSYWLNITISGTSLVETKHNFTVSLYGTAYPVIISPAIESVYNQGQRINFTVDLQDLLGYNITEAIVTVNIHGSTYTLDSSLDGIYTKNVTTAGFPISKYNVTISISHSYLNSTDIIFEISIKGSANVALSTSPSTIYNDGPSNFTFTVTDTYGNPIKAFNYSITFANSSTSGTSNSYILWWAPTPNVLPKSYWLNISITGSYLVSSRYNYTINVLSNAAVSVISPTIGSSYIQGSKVNFSVRVQDQIGFNITNAQVVVLLSGSTTNLDHIGNGVYSANISTLGLKLNLYNATITINHGYLYSNLTYRAFILKGSAYISYESDPSIVYNHQNVNFTFTVRDQYGNPIDPFNYSITFANSSTTGTSNSFNFWWAPTPNVAPNSYWLNVTLNGTYLVDTKTNFSIALMGSTSLTIMKPIDASSFVQSSDVNVTVSLEDLIGTKIDSATVTVELRGSTYTLDSKGNGIYNYSIRTVGFTLGLYNATVKVTHGFLTGSQEWVTFLLIGECVISQTHSPDPAPNQGDVTFNFTITDLYGNPINDFNYSLNFYGDANPESTDGISDSYKFAWEIYVSEIVGNYWLNVTINSTYVIESQKGFSIPLKGTAAAKIISPIAFSSYLQGENITFTVNVTDESKNPIIGADVTVVLYGSTYTLVNISDGLYSVNATTSGLPLGKYTAHISVDQAFIDPIFLDLELSLEGEVNVVATSEPLSIGNDDNVTFTISVSDQYGNPMNGYNFSYSMDFGEIFNTSGYSNSYKFTWKILPNVKPGYYNLTVNITGDYITYGNLSKTFTVYSRGDITILSPSLGSTYHQGTESIYFNVNLTDSILNPMNGSTVKVVIHGSTYILGDNQDGTYETTVSTSGWLPGEWDYTIQATHLLLETAEATGSINVESGVLVSIDIPTNFLNNQSSILNFTVTDEAGNALTNYDFSYSLSIGSTITTSGSSNDSIFSWTVTPSLIPGQHLLNVTISGNYLVTSYHSEKVAIVSHAEPTVHELEGSYSQGADIQFVVDIEDLIGNLIQNAEVKVLIRGRSFALADHHNGTYSTDISTSGWIPGEYDFDVSVVHTYLDYDEIYTDSVIVMGSALIRLEQPDKIFNHESAILNFSVSDINYYPLQNYQYSLDIENIITSSGISASQTYSVTITPDVSPGVYRLTLVVSGTYIEETTFNITIDIFGRPSLDILSPKNGGPVEQGENAYFEVNITDLLGSVIEGAQCTVNLYGSSYTLLETSTPGIYSNNITTSGLRLGRYNGTITVTHDYLVADEWDYYLDIIGYVSFSSFSYDRDSAFVGSEITFDIAIGDKYRNPVTDFDWDAEIFGVIISGNQTENNTFSVTYYVPGPPLPNYLFRLNITGDFIIWRQLNQSINIESECIIQIHQPLTNASFIQEDEDIPFIITITDVANHTINEAQVVVDIHETEYLLLGLGDGIYGLNISTDGWPHDEYEFTVKVNHDQLVSNEAEGNVNVKAKLQIEFDFLFLTIYQNDTLIVNFTITDVTNKPVEGLSPKVHFLDDEETASEGTPGKYSAKFEIPTNQTYGVYNITVSVEEGVICTTCQAKQPISVDVLVPQISMTEGTFIQVSTFMFFVSLVGMLIYFKLVSSLSTLDISPEGLKRSLGKLDKTYGIILLGGLALFGHSWVLAGAGQYDLALIEAVGLLGISVLLYGLWLYRDAFSTILVTHKISQKRRVLGIWHLLLVPIMIWQIFEFGQYIQLFQRYILTNQFVLGELQFPAILVTVFGTYLSSIVIVVVTFYKEVSKGLERIMQMEAVSTPSIIVDGERQLLVERVGSSIRMKFLMFLVLLAATTVSSLEFLRQYSLAVIVMLPLVFLVVIPFISSKIAKSIPKIASRMKSRKGRKPKAIDEIADEEIRIDELSVEELREYTKMDIEEDTDDDE